MKSSYINKFNLIEGLKLTRIFKKRYPLNFFLYLFIFLFITKSLQAQTQNFAWARMDQGVGADAGNAITTDAAGNVYTAGYFDGTVDFNPGAATSYLSSVGSTDVFIMKTDVNGNFVWAKRVGGPGYEYASSIAVDASGNVYISGEFNGVADFDPGAATYNLTKVSTFQGAAFILKLDLSGNFVWAKQFGGNTGTFIINKILLDASANVFVTGASVYTNDFDPNAGTVFVASVYEDAFVLKLTTAGVFSYVKMISSIGPVEYAIGLDMEFDPLGNIVLVGMIHGTFDLDPGAGVASFTTVGFGDCFVAKYSAAGAHIWSGITGGITPSIVVWNSQLAVDAAGDIYITNYCSGGNVDFDIKAGVFNVNVSSGKTSVQKLNSAGNLVWVKLLGFSCWSAPICAGTTGIYISGYFSNTADFNPGAAVFNMTSSISPNSGFKENDIYIVKLDTAGTFIWALKYGSLEDDYVNQICLDGSENIHSTGYYYGQGDFDPGAGIKLLSSNGNEEIFVQKLTNAGLFLWAYGVGAETYQVVMASSNTIKNSLYSTGCFESGLNYYSGSKGGLDIFVESISTSGWSLQKNYYMGGPGEDCGTAIVTDTARNVYLTGYFSLTADFRPTRNEPSFPLIAAGAKDIFILKINASGDLVWAKRLGGVLDEESNSICLDAGGNLILTGYYQGTVDFNPGALVNNLSSAGGLDAFVLKLDTAGNFVWARSMGGVSNDIGNAVTADAAGNIITTGSYNGTADLNPSAAILNVTSVGSIDLFIQKLNAAGTFVWGKSIGSTSNDKGTSITTDALGNVICAGSFGLTADFDPGAGVSNLTAPNSLGDIFLLQLSSAGNFSWARSMGGTGIDLVSSITLDKYGNIYSTGSFAGTADFDPSSLSTFNAVSTGSNDVFVHCYRPASGTWWVKTFGGTGNDYGVGIALDDSSNFYTVGNFTGTVDFDPGISTFNLTAMGAIDIFVQKMSQVSVLPITLLSFSAMIADAQTVYCDWSTASEINNDYFTVEKSRDGIHFEEAGRIEGAGFSNTTLDYYFNDQEPFNGLSYYRLKQTDFNGETSYSKVVAIINRKQNTLAVYPNITSGSLFITGISKDENQIIEIVDSKGINLIKYNFGRGTETAEFDLSKYTSGLYFVRIYSKEKVSLFKIIKT